LRETPILAAPVISSPVSTTPTLCTAAINLNMLEACRRRAIRGVFYSSSACIYPAHNQADPERPNCAEDSAYPAAPDSEYGSEKLFSERLYLAYNRNSGMRNRIARYHNIFGPEGTWRGGKEKTPAAICRKVAMARAGDEIEIWGDGSQTRSFLHVNECLEGTLWLMRSGTCDVSVNIGSEEMVTIDQLVDIVSDIAGKPVTKRHVSGPTGVRGRNSNTRLIREKLYWPPSRPLREGMQQTYAWIDQRVRANTDSGA